MNTHRCHCEVLRSSLSRYLSEQSSNAEALLTSREFLQSEEGQNASLFRRLRAYLSSTFELEENLLQEIVVFQTEHMALWLAGIAELKAAANHSHEEYASPNWYAYDKAFYDLLFKALGDEGKARELISEVNTAKTKIWISIREPKVDPAFLMLAARDFESQLNIIGYSCQAIEGKTSLAELKNTHLFDLPKVFSSYKSLEVSPFLENLAQIEKVLGIQDEFLKTRANLGLQMRHAHAHGDGRLDSRSIGRLTEPFVGVLNEGVRIPLGSPEHNFGAEFFMDVFAALIASLYQATLDLSDHDADCVLPEEEEFVAEVPELIGSLPKTWEMTKKF